MDEEINKAFKQWIEVKKKRPTAKRHYTQDKTEKKKRSAPAPKGLGEAGKTKRLSHGNAPTVKPTPTKTPSMINAMNRLKRERKTAKPAPGLNTLVETIERTGVPKNKIELEGEPEKTSTLHPASRLPDLIRQKEQAELLEQAWKAEQRAKHNAGDSTVVISDERAPIADVDTAFSDYLKRKDSVINSDPIKTKGIKRTSSTPRLASASIDPRGFTFGEKKQRVGSDVVPFNVSTQDYLNPKEGVRGPYKPRKAKVALMNIPEAQPNLPTEKRKRGRPVGSKNRQKGGVTMPNTVKKSDVEEENVRKLKEAKERFMQAISNSKNQEDITRAVEAYVSESEKYGGLELPNVKASRMPDKVDAEWMSNKDFKDDNQKDSNRARMSRERPIVYPKAKGPIMQGKVESTVDTVFPKKTMDEIATQDVENSNIKWAKEHMVKSWKEYEKTNETDGMKTYMDEDAVADSVKNIGIKYNKPKPTVTDNTIPEGVEKAYRRWFSRDEESKGNDSLYRKYYCENCDDSGAEASYNKNTKCMTCDKCGKEVKEIDNN